MPRDVRIYQGTSEDRALLPLIVDLLTSVAREPGVVLLHGELSKLSDALAAQEVVIAESLSERAVVGVGVLVAAPYSLVVAHRSIVVHPEWRRRGIGRGITRALHQIMRERYPQRRLVSLTVNASLVRINESLGYRVVPLKVLTPEVEFWACCRQCRYHDTLERFAGTRCFCVGMVAPDSSRE